MDQDRYSVLKNQYIGHSIGFISYGIDGNDEYLLVNDNTDDIDLKECDAFYEMAYGVGAEGCDLRPGAYFCSGVTVMPKPYRNNEVVVVIHHRYNV